MLKAMAHKLPDGGAELQRRKQALYQRLDRMKNPPRNLEVMKRDLEAGASKVILASKKGITLQAKALTQGAVEHMHK